MRARRFLAGAFGALAALLVGAASAQVAIFAPRIQASYDFAHSVYTGGASIADLTNSRSTTELVESSTGVWSSCSANALCVTDLGLWNFPGSTNNALWARDETNAAWVKTSMTAALTQTGIDNGASSATLLTATSTSATSLQTLTLASGTYAYSVFIKCVTCAGVISGGINATGTGYSSLTASTCVNAITGVSTAINASGHPWVRCTVNSATVTTAVFGLSFANNADSLIVDGVKVESSTSPIPYPTGPIFTTTVAVTNNSDTITAVANSPIDRLLRVPAGFVVFSLGPLQTTVNGSRAMSFGGNWALIASGQNNVQMNDGTTTISSNAGSGITLATIGKAAFAWNGNTAAATMLGVMPTLGANVRSTATGTISIGDLAAGNRSINGPIRSLALGAGFPPAAFLSRLVNCPC